LCGLIIIVDVVKGTGQAVVEDGAGAESERAVATNAPLTLAETTGLNRCIELELVVGGDVSNASLGVQEVAAFQSKSDGATARFLAANDWAAKDLIQTTGHLSATGADVGGLE